VGQDVPGDHGRQRMKLLADLEVAIKAVERPAEAFGEDIAAREQAEIQPAVQLDLPMVMGKAVPIVYVQMDGSAGGAERDGGSAKQDAGQPAHPREVKLGSVFNLHNLGQAGFPPSRS